MAIRGFSYPFSDNFEMATVEGTINSSIYQLLMTEKGERVMSLYFGVKLRDVFFESISSNDSFLLREIEGRVSNAINTFEQRIVVKSPGVKAYLHDQGNGDGRNTVLIKFQWALKEDIATDFSFSQSISRTI